MLKLNFGTRVPDLKNETLEHGVPDLVKKMFVVELVKQWNFGTHMPDLAKKNVCGGVREKLKL